MSEMKLAILALVVLASPVAAADNICRSPDLAARQSDAMQAYSRCGMAYGIKLAPSGSDPDDIATAAESTCGPERISLHDASTNCRNRRYADMAVARIEKSFRQSVIATVVEARATSSQPSR